METAIIESVTEKHDPQYGPEKISKLILQPSGESRTAYTKPAVKDVYDNLRAGLMVELKPKPGGKGYWINKILPNGTTTPAPAQPGNGQARANGADPKAIGEYIKTAAGQYAYCVKMLREKFDEAGVADITDDLLKAGATSIFIATKDKFH